MILFVNACIRTNSRSKLIADYLLKKIDKPYKQIDVFDIDYPLMNEKFLDYREELINNKQFDLPLFEIAHDFAQAEEIVIATPYWDLSFPACLKQYFEHINIRGITFEYSEEGYPISLCKANKLYYVTSAGGQFVPEEYGYGYIKTLAENFYGIKDVRLIIAKGLDIKGSDPDQIIKDCIDSIKI